MYERAVSGISASSAEDEPRFDVGDQARGQAATAALWCLGYPAQLPLLFGIVGAGVDLHRRACADPAAARLQAQRWGLGVDQLLGRGVVGPLLGGRAVAVINLHLRSGRRGSVGHVNAPPRTDPVDLAGQRVVHVPLLPGAAVVGVQPQPYGVDAVLFEYKPGLDIGDPADARTDGLYGPSLAGHYWVGGVAFVVGDGAVVAGADDHNAAVRGVQTVLAAVSRVVVRPLGRVGHRDLLQIGVVGPDLRRRRRLVARVQLELRAVGP